MLSSRVIWLGVLVLVLSGCQSINLGTGKVSTVNPRRDVDEISATFSKSELLFSAARKFEKAGQIEEAIKLYEKAAGVSAANELGLIEANHHLAILYDLSDQPKRASQAFQAAMMGKDPNVELLNDYGYFLLKQNEFAEAAKVLSVAHEEFPKNERIANNLGMALVSSGKVEDGFRMFESSVGKADAIANVGAILLQTGRIEEGKAWLQQVADTSDLNNKANQMLRAASNFDSSK